jgi:hypothetical protein
MFKRVVLALLSSIVLMGLSACGSQEADVLDGIIWQKYVSQCQDFSIELPSDWNVTAELTTCVYVEDPTGAARFVVSLERGIGDYTLEEYADIWYKAGSDWGASSPTELISSSQLKIDGSIPAKEYTEKYQHNGEDDKGTEVFFVSGGNGYKIYAESYLDEYDGFKPIFDYILQSFHITDIASSKVVWKTYTNEEYGFTARIPDDWYAETYGDSGVVIYDPSNDSEGFLTVKEHQGASLGELSAAVTAAYQEEYEKYEILSEKTLSIGGIEAKETLCVMDYGEGEYKGKTVGFISGELYYSITCFTKTDAYVLYESTWDTIFSSFAFESELQR